MTSCINLKFVIESIFSLRQPIAYFNLILNLKIFLLINKGQDMWIGYKNQKQNVWHVCTKATNENWSRQNIQVEK